MVAYIWIIMLWNLGIDSVNVIKFIILHIIPILVTYAIMLNWQSNTSFLLVLDPKQAHGEECDKT